MNEQDAWVAYWAKRTSDNRNRIVVVHLQLVTSVALRMLKALPAHIALSELLSDGVVGLIRAVERFAPDRGVPFRAFAAISIRNAIRDGLRDRDYLTRPHRSALKRQKRDPPLLLSLTDFTPDDPQFAIEGHGPEADADADADA